MRLPTQARLIFECLDLMMMAESQASLSFEDDNATRA